ncbi:MAG: N-acetylmuramoyl-L-alanine amidase [Oscillospiraceae bacterium]|nr:N-acetylmuramoyl-L-alanine amidase [Oscillospiraceae bacterium]
MRRDLAAYLIWFCVTLSVGISFFGRIAPAFSGSARSAPPVIVLDAGHGGEDGGAVSPAGVKESDINLSIVLKTRSLLAFLGVDTVLTRSDDSANYDAGCTTLREKKVSDLKNRVKQIKSIPNAMLVSVHQNSFTDSRYHGAQVFHASGETSGQWGEYTQTLFRTALDPQNNRKPCAIPEHVYLFKHISCPAILVECGFLTNGEEASLLVTEAYQRKIALVLAGSCIHQLEMTPETLGGD